MCGIAGVLYPDGRPPDPSGVRAMLDALVHRGPDAWGLYEGRGVCAGIRRLRVIDLATGDQPIANEDGSVEVVFNGEIYNYRELRDDLAARGHRLRTASDTEVLVHLWEDEGEAMLGRLNGMFAFCLHDRRTGETILARDRIGVKPLYLAPHGGGVVFASEAPALFRFPGLERRVDHGRLLDAFFLQYVPGEGTLFEGVVKLLPGHVLRLKDGRLDTTRWFRPPPEDEAGEPAPTARAATHALREIVEEAVTLETVADVPIGVFLSGGLDSTIVASILARAGAGLETFSVGFEGPGTFDERSFARRVAERLGARHHELVLSPEEAAATLPSIVARLEEPVLDPALLPTMLLARFARERVTVVLTGEGADELFGGYRRHAWQERLGRFAAVPGLAAAARVGARAGLIPRRHAQALEALGTSDPAVNHVIWSCTVAPSQAGSLFEPAALGGWERSAAGRFSRYFRRGSDLGARLEADLHEWLPHNLLAKVDRASMAYSLEARVPFLDPRVVSQARALPDSLKISGGVSKRVLRAAFAGAVPAEILQRPKHGFDLPLGSWLRGPLASLARERLPALGPDLWPGLRKGAPEVMLRRHAEGRDDLGLPLFLLLTIALFLEGTNA